MEIKVFDLNEELGMEADSWTEKTFEKDEEFELEYLADQKLIVIKGNAELQANKKNFNLKKNDCVFIPQLSRCKWIIKKDFSIKYMYDIH